MNKREMLVAKIMNLVHAYESNIYTNSELKDKVEFEVNWFLKHEAPAVERPGTQSAPADNSAKGKCESCAKLKEELKRVKRDFNNLAHAK